MMRERSRLHHDLTGSALSYPCQKRFYTSKPAQAFSTAIRTASGSSLKASSSWQLRAAVRVVVHGVEVLQFLDDSQVERF